MLPVYSAASQCMYKYRGRTEFPFFLVNLDFVFFPFEMISKGCI